MWRGGKSYLDVRVTPTFVLEKRASSLISPVRHDFQLLVRPLVQISRALEG